jgi:hypothetical protein
MATPASVYVGIIDGDGNVSIISGDKATNFASATLGVLIAVKSDSGGGNMVWSRYKGVPSLNMEFEADGTVDVYEYDSQTCRVHCHPEGGSLATRTLESGTEEVAGSAQFNHDIYKKGKSQGTDYDAKVLDVGDLIAVIDSTYPTAWQN